MKNDRRLPGKTAVILGSLLALSAAVSGGCRRADTDAGSLNSERGNRILPETSSSTLPSESGEYRSASSENRHTGNDSCQKTSSENGGEAHWGSHTTVVLDGNSFDIEDREPSVNAITDVRAVEGYWLVTGHISPKASYYGFYNPETLQWDKEIVGGSLTWYGADEKDAEIPFSMDTIVYTIADELHDSDGTLICTIELNESEYEEIRGLKCISTADVEVHILNAAVEERTVLVQR